MESIFGIIFHSIGGFASGSFYIPYNKVKSWAWESAWIVGGVVSWLLVPTIAAYLTVPDFMGIIKNTDSNVIFWTYLMGLLWGIGGLTFGLAMRYLGMSLGMSIALSLCSIFGALVPAIYRDFFTTDTVGTFSYMLANTGGQVVLVGILVCLVGILVCGKAGMMKESELTDAQKKDSIKEFNLTKGLIVAT
ncbi:MAG: rhamnose/proton symporter RhaT, partial [Runella slithyformis]